MSYVPKVSSIQFSACFHFTRYFHFHTVAPFYQKPFEMPTNRLTKILTPYHEFEIRNFNFNLE